MQSVLDNNTGNGITEVIDNGDTFVVKFAKSERYYEVDSNGNVSEYEVIVDENPGNITVGINGENLSGTEDSPYEIWCIEDLVEWSNNYSTYSSAYIILCTTLNFESRLSYADSTRTDYGDLNDDDITDDILTELTKTDDGCIGFPAITSFNGTFDGQGYEIKNIYQHVNTSNQSTALFKSANEVKNLTLTGTIINDAWHAAGICASGTTITNCKNYADITGYNAVGGIGAYQVTTITNCENYGTITRIGRYWAYGGAGGIAGAAVSTIEKSTNYGNVIDCLESSAYQCTAGGILGYSGGSCTINNCVNFGECIAGILGFCCGSGIALTNCYNCGECESGLVHHFWGSGWSQVLGLTIQNCYNIGNASTAGILGAIGTVCAEITLNIENCYNAGVSGKAIIGSLSTDSRTTTTTNISNTYYDTSKSTSVGATSDGITELEESDIKNNSSFVEILNNNIGENTDWATWVLGDDGYPTFE